MSIDINFPNHPHVYGIPQHATRLSLPTTRGENATFSDPFRLYNADVFEYLASSPMSVYGSIPLIYGHSTQSTTGVFYAVGSETWIDVKHTTPGKSSETHWVSESGVMDIFILPGPNPDAVFKQYARLTGTPVLPAHWALAYHQCRWNYVSSDDVRSVQKRFDEEDMPVDVFWLDIEYADDHKYFMWNEKTFPDPVEMTNDVVAIGRKVSSSQRSPPVSSVFHVFLYDRWSPSSTPISSALRITLPSSKLPTRNSSSNPSPAQANTRAGVGQAAPPGSTSSTLQFWSGGRRFSNSRLLWMGAGAGRRAQRMFTSGMT